MPALGPFSVSNLPSVYFDGVWRPLSCLPSKPGSFDAAPKFGAVFQANLDPSQWQEIDLEWYNLPILDQGATSSCVAHAGCSGAEMGWVQSGRPLQEFNPFFLYGLINGGMDRGASISDAMNALTQVGICSKSALPPNVMFKQEFPQTAFEDAANYKLVKTYHCQTWEDICSAISLGFPTVLGIYVGQNFPQLDSEGVAPLPNGGGGGHALLGMGLKKSSRYGWIIKIQNSWGIRYGQQGHAYLQRHAFDYMQIDSFTVQGMGGADPDTPVVTN